MKLNIAKLHAFLTIQFMAAPHWVDEVYTDADGNKVTVKTNPTGPCLAFAKDEKKGTFSINLGVPAGPNTRVPVSASLENADRDKVAALIEAAIKSVAGEEAKLDVIQISA